MEGKNHTKRDHQNKKQKLYTEQELICITVEKRKLFPDGYIKRENCKQRRVHILQKRISWSLTKQKLHHLRMDFYLFERILLQLSSSIIWELFSMVLIFSLVIKIYFKVN